jgi:hypothetical protein
VSFKELYFIALRKHGWILLLFFSLIFVIKFSVQVLQFSNVLSIGRLSAFVDGRLHSDVNYDSHPSGAQVPAMQEGRHPRSLIAFGEYRGKVMWAINFQEGKSW